jgi:hypothetical protein
LSLLFFFFGGLWGGPPPNAPQRKKTSKKTNSTPIHFNLLIHKLFSFVLFSGIIHKERVGKEE